MPPSRLDQVYRSILLTKFFTKGWGNPDNLRRIFEFRKFVANRETCYSLVPKKYPIEITKDEEWSDCHVIEGQFESPFEKHLPGIMPEETKNAYFQMILPKHWISQKVKPVCLHLAGTGDHFFWRRRNLVAKPLLKEHGIASVLLENPFYGLRKPRDQVRSCLHNVSDIFIMGGCLIFESIVILNWLEQEGYGPLGLTGLSMGGHMASLAATSWPKPIPLVPCLSWSTAAPVFTQGVMSASINWALLESQYFSNRTYQNDLAKMVKSIEQNDAFLAGQHFAKHYPASMRRLSRLQQEVKDCNNNINNSKSKNEKIVINSDGNGLIAEEQVEKEQEAAKLFPLNLLSNSFLNKNDSEAAKGICLLPVSKHPLFTDKKWREHEALQFMRGIMDECTNLQNFDVPVDTSLIIAVCAKDDAYVPRDDCIDLETIWPGVEIRYVDAGHVSAYLFYQKMFRQTIAESFNRYLKKYPIADS